MQLLTVKPSAPPSGNFHKIFLNQEFMSGLDLYAGDIVILRAGSVSMEVEVLESSEGSYILQDTLSNLDLPDQRAVWLKAETSKLLQLGPIIGILIGREKKYRKPPFSSQKRLLQQFLNHCLSANYIAYVFSPDGVSTTDNKVVGHTIVLGKDGIPVWKTQCYPLPDVVYDRILHRTMEKKLLTKKITNFLKNKKTIQYFNPRFLNKWETHFILNQNPLVSQHLPDTKELDIYNNLAEFLKTYPTIYLKPINGSLSIGIVRLTTDSEGFHWQCRKGGQNCVKTFQDYNELVLGLKAYKGNTLYVIQQGLNLLRFRDRVFDLRVLVQKDGQGNWLVSAIVARVAKEGNIFPNIAAGGTATNIETVWQDFSDTEWSSSPTKELVEKVSLAAAETLENALGTFGEIGLDIGIDNDGNIWVIEVNSKPSRKVFPKEQLALKKTSLRLPMDFAAHLSGFSHQLGWMNSE